MSHNLDNHDIMVLLWHVDHDEDDEYHTPGAVYDNTMADLRRAGLINPNNDGISERGRVFADLILDTPLPVQRWVDPR